jgi:RNA polymerase sigma-70 factor (ECF subfamily)
MTTLPDTTLIKFAKDGNSEAVTVLYRRHQAFLLAASRTYAGGDLEPDDLVQEAWLRILNQLDRFTPQKSFRAWAITVLRNLGRDHATRRSRHKRLLEIHHHDVAGERVDGRSLVRERAAREMVQSALEPLTARQRLALWLHVGERMPSAEVSRTMGCTPPTVRTTCFFALERIRKAIQAGRTPIAN